MMLHIARYGESLAVLSCVRKFRSERDRVEENSARASAVSRELLAPGDVVRIEDKPLPSREVVCAINNQYVVRIPKLRTTIFLKRGDSAISNENCLISWTGSREFLVRSGIDGRIDIDIPVTVRHIAISLESTNQPLRISVGTLHAANTLPGMISRLCNLGFLSPLDCSDEDLVQRKIASFQRKHGLPETGFPDNETVAKLVSLHCDQFGGSHD